MNDYNAIAADLEQAVGKIKTLGWYANGNEKYQDGICAGLAIMSREAAFFFSDQLGLEGRPWRNIYHWNDSQSSVRPVLAALRKAAKKARELA